MFEGQGHKSKFTVNGEKNKCSATADRGWKTDPNWKLKISKSQLDHIRQDKPRCHGRQILLQWSVRPRVRTFYRLRYKYTDESVMKEFRKSVRFWRSCGQRYCATFL